MFLEPSFSVVRRHCRGMLVGSISLHLYGLFMLGAMFQLTTGAGICERDKTIVNVCYNTRTFFINLCLEVINLISLSELLTK